MTDTAEDEWIEIEAVSEILGLASPHRALRESAVATRPTLGRGTPLEYRLADVLALKELRAAPRPFSSHSGDLCGHAGALRLKQRIEAYWQARGATVSFQIVSGGYVQAMRSARFDVRSDMLNGWPRGWVESK